MWPFHTGDRSQILIQMMLNAFFYPFFYPDKKKGLGKRNGNNPKNLYKPYICL